MCRAATVGYGLVDEDVSGASRRKIGTGDGIECNIATKEITVDTEVEVAAGGEGKGSKVGAGDWFAEALGKRRESVGQHTFSREVLWA